MAVIRVEKTKNYTVMSNYHLKEEKMSLKAKGLLSLMLSLPDNWDYSIEGLSSICVEGIKGVNSALKELEKFGYLKRNKIRNKKGIIVDWEYCIYEEPVVPKPQVDEPHVDEGEQLNTNSINSFINQEENIIKENPNSQNQTLSAEQANLSNKFELSQNARTREKSIMTDQADTQSKTSSLDSAKEKEIEDIYNYWNSLGKPMHQGLTDKFKKAINKALKDYSTDEIKKAMSNYKTVLNDKDYFFNYVWGIDTFLKQSNCLPHFVDSGEKWINYCNKKGISPTRVQEKKEYKPDEHGMFNAW